MSDTAADGSSEDKTGPLIKSVLEAEGSIFHVISSGIVKDDALAIERRTAEAAQSKAQLVLTLGGTGFSPRDVTPEVVKSMIVKEAPGLVHVMLQQSLQITQLASLGRPVAGLTANNTLIITLPGSPKGAKENLQALLPVLSHALQLANGSSSRQLHAQQPSTASDSTCPHGHVKPVPKSHDPSLGRMCPCVMEL